MSVVTKISLGLALSVLLAACEGPAPGPSEGLEEVLEQSAVEHAAKHADPRYVCPMHPQIVRDAPGSCPICGMNLVLKEAQAEAGGQPRKPLYWVAPMDPNFRRDKPGKSPMGMDLVPVYADEAGPEVQVSAAVINNLGVRTAPVERGRLYRMIETVGYVGFDESRISHIHLRTEGWIERLSVQSVGERVKAGVVLFDLYSPTLINAQEEYVQALGSSNQNLVRASRDRLLALGIPEGQVRALGKTRKLPQTTRFLAPQDGVVAALNVREGMFVRPALEIMSLADLSTVWVLVEVFERQTDWVQVGQRAQVRSSFIPGREWEGRVEYVYPTLDPKTRTLQVRLRFDNPDEALKPNMYADVRIFGAPRDEVTKIPREALIRTGDEERVILALGEGRFRARKVRSGMESGEWVEILSGVAPGEEVVTSGQFLIDSESSLKAGLQRLSEPQADAGARPQEGS